MPARPRHLWPHLAGVVGFAASAELGVGKAALDRLGISVWAATLLLLAAVACRSTNLPLWVMRGGRRRLDSLPQEIQQTMLRWHSPFAEETSVALNVGGGLIPLAFAACAMSRDPISLPLGLMVSVLVAGVTEFNRRLAIHSTVVLPYVLLAPATAPLLGWTVGAEHRTALTYVGGLAGILAGADLLHLRDLRNIGAPEVVVGAGASFDAVFLNQLFSFLFSG